MSGLTETQFMRIPGYKTEEVLRRLAVKQGDRTQKALAEEMGISDKYLSDVLNGRRDPGPAILQFVGLEPGYIEAEDAA